MPQNFSGYPTYPVGTQEKNYSAGGAGGSPYALPSTQLRQPIKSSDTTTKTAGAPVPGTTAGGASPVARPAPNVATQAPSPAITLARPVGPYVIGGGARPNPTPGAGMPYQVGGAPPPAATPPAATPPVSIDPGNVNAPGLPAGPAAPPAGPAGPPPTPAGPGQSGGPIGMGNLGALIEQLLGAPSQYGDEYYQKTYQGLTGQLHDDVEADAAKRGLDYTSVPTDIYGREAGKIATNLSADAARTYHDNLVQSLGLASGFGQQAFDNGMATNQQQLQVIQMLMGLGQYANAPLDGAVDADFDWSGAMGQQGQGSAEISQYLMSLLPFLGGGGGGGSVGTPPFNPNGGASAHFPGWDGKV